MPQPFSTILRFLVCVIPLATSAGQPILASGDVPGTVITGTTRYEGKALYGYIDGGADLYHEYGFVRLVVQDLSFNGDDQTVELYEMKGDTAAFGIFSVSRAQCIGVDSLGQHSCVSSYQSMFAAGRFFVRVLNPTGSPRASAGSLRIAAAIRRKTGAGELTLPEVFRRKIWDGRRSGVQYVSGPLGVQNGAAGWSELLDGLEPYDAFLLSSSLAGADVVLADIRFTSADRMAGFLQRTANTPRRRVHTLTSTRLMYFDGPDSLRHTIMPGTE